MIARATPSVQVEPAISDVGIHPLRAEDMRLDYELEQRGLRAIHKPNIVKPWKWRRLQNLYYRLGYVPSPGQRQFHQSTARFKCLVGGSRYGKTWVLPRDVIPTILSPGTLTWIVGPTYDLAAKEWDYLLADLETLGLLQLATTRQMGRPGRLVFPWGARVETRSADNPSSLLGAEVNDMIIAEGSQLDERVMNRYLRARLGPRLGRLLLATTPFGFNWVRKLWERGMVQEAALRDGTESLATIAYQESVRAWQFSVLENPYFEPAEYLAAQKDMPPEEFAEQYDGRFTSMSGRLFPAFTRGTHVLPASKLPRELHSMPVFRTVDFGFSNPSVCLWVVYDREGCIKGVPPRTWWVVGEVYKRQLLTEQLAEQIKAHDWTRSHRIVCTIGDMADAQARATMARHGVPCAEDLTRVQDGEKVPINKAWDAGIRTLRALFHQGRIRISDECRETIRELTEATFADDSKDRQVLGQDDHACFPAGELVSTPTGPRPIETLRVGDEVLSHDGMVSRVEAHACTGEKPILRLMLSGGGTIRCTDDHPLAVEGGGWVEARYSLGATLHALPTSARRATKLSASLATAGERRATTPADTASVQVLTIERLPELVPVYAMATSCGTYYVGGVLVSNCDALRYLCHTVSPV